MCVCACARGKERPRHLVMKPIQSSWPSLPRKWMAVGHSAAARRRFSNPASFVAPTLWKRSLFKEDTSTGWPYPGCACVCVRVCALERQERERDRESLYLYVCQYMYIHIFVYFDMYIYINVQCICFIRIYTRESNHVSRLHVLYVCMYTYVWLRSVGSIK